MLENTPSPDVDGRNVANMMPIPNQRKRWAASLVFSSLSRYSVKLWMSLFII